MADRKKPGQTKHKADPIQLKHPSKSERAQNMYCFIYYKNVPIQ